jgi:hypothetical protein
MSLQCSSDGSVGIATGYGLDDGRVGIRDPVDSRLYSPPRCPDRPWDLPSLLSSGYRRLFPGGRALLWQLQSVITAHNKWLLKIRPIPYWTTIVFCPTVTNDARRITYELTEFSNQSHVPPVITSKRTKCRSPSQTVPPLYSVYLLLLNVCLASRWLVMDCSLPR